MNPQVTPAPDGAANNSGARPDGTPNTAPAGAPAAGQPTGEPWRNPDEIKANFVKVRSLETQVAELTTKLAALSPPPPTTTAKASAGEAGAPDANAIAASATAAAMFEMGMATSGFTPEQAQIVRTLFTAEKPAPDRMAEWMKGKLAAFGRTQAGADGKATPPAQTQVRTDLGAPGAKPADPNALPSDPRLIPPQVWRGMTSEQRLEIQRKFRAGQGGSGLMRNPNRK